MVNRRTTQLYMEERFENEFVTWRHNTPVGVKVDEVFGMDSKTGKVWKELAMQIFCEQGDNYREIDHFPNGAPFIYGVNARFSLTHTTHFLAGAILPKTPELNLENFNPRSAMGIDAEPLNRTQVLKIREKFLSESELILIDKEDIEANIIAWTSKEALYKAAFTPGLDFRENIRIIELPVLDKSPEIKKPVKTGTAEFMIPIDGKIETVEMILYSYESYGCCVTIALSTKAATFKKGN